MKTSSSRRNFLTQTASLGAAAGALGAGHSAFASTTAAPAAPAASATWDFLQPGDTIAVIAPSSPPSNPERSYEAIRAYFAKTDFKVFIPQGLVQPTTPLQAANTAEQRVAFIEQALNSEAKAVWALLGGGWGTELMPLLKKMKQPATPKPVIGYSDVTALHIFLNQFWGWPSLHSVELGANGDILPTDAWNKNPLVQTLDVLTGKAPRVAFALTALNQTAQRSAQLNGLRVLGGNSLLLSALNGTQDFTLDTRNAIVFIESVALNPGELSRILDGYLLSKLVQQCAGVMFGSCLEKGGHPNPPASEAQFDYIQRRLGAALDVLGKPVLRADNLFGHGAVNLPLPLNTDSTLRLGAAPQLSVASR